MRKTITILLVLLASSSILGVLSVDAESETIVVPDDYPTISDAIENTVNDDTIFVKAGTYEGLKNQTLTINKTLTIKGENPENTIISLHPELVTTYYPGGTSLSSYADAIKIEADSVQISGFTIKSDGGKIRTYAEGAEISGNILKVDTSLLGFHNLFTENKLISSNVFCSCLQEDAYKPHRNTINHNTVINGRIQSDSGRYNEILKNRVVGTIVIGGTSNHELVYDNIVIGNGNQRAGISVASISSVIANNTISNCIVGISIDWGSNNIACGNFITNNSGSALLVESGYKAAVFANRISDNTVGIQLKTWQFVPIYNNNFINNGLQAEFLLDRLGFWSLDNNDNRGNYWSDYSGSDSNNDGIGDSMYSVNSSIGDHFPLIHPFDIDSFNTQLASMPDIYQEVMEMVEYLSESPIPQTPSPSQTPSSNNEPVSGIQVSLFLTFIISAIFVSILIIVYNKKRKH